MKTAIKLIVICAALSAFLVGMVMTHEQARKTGREVIVDMTPVDPRSLLRGYYVRIRTPLRTLNTAALAGDDAFSPGQTVYVGLKTDEKGAAIAQSITHARPDSGLFIQGRVRRSWKGVLDGNELDVRYNIESYFADEQAAKALQNQINAHKMRLILALGKEGKAVIRGLEIDGVRQLDSLW